MNEFSASQQRIIQEIYQEHLQTFQNLHKMSEFSGKEDLDEELQWYFAAAVQEIAQELDLNENVYELELEWLCMDLINMASVACQEALL